MWGEKDLFAHICTEKHKKQLNKQSILDPYIHISELNSWRFCVHLCT